MANVRKQINHLTIDDITRYPIWEFALDEEGEEGQDETTVRPVDPSQLDFEQSSYMVRAHFRTANGKTFLGLITVDDMEDDDLIKIEGDLDSNNKHQPTIITPHGQVAFWLGTIMLTNEQLTAAYKSLGVTKSDSLFPITYATDDSLPFDIVKGQISGFLYLEDTTNELEFVMRIQK